VFQTRVNAGHAGGIHSQKANIIFTGSNPAAGSRHATHLCDYPFRIGNVLKQVSGVDQIKTVVFKLQPVRVPLGVGNGGITGSCGDLLARLFDSDNPNIRCGAGYGDRQQSKSASDFEDSHVCMHVQKLDECRIRQSIQDFKALLLAPFCAVNVAHRALLRIG
jgi:hypothetical protein